LRTLLDTTYLLPAIGVSVKGMPNDAIEKLISRGEEILISEISLFELSAKGAKYVLEGALSPDRLTKGIVALSNDDSITKVRVYDSKTLRLAFRFRELLGDFIDCLILSSAALECDTLVTEDDEIHGLAGQNQFEGIMASAGSACKIRRLAETLLP